MTTKKYWKKKLHPSKRKNLKETWQTTRGALSTSGISLLVINRKPRQIGREQGDADGETEMDILHQPKAPHPLTPTAQVF